MSGSENELLRQAVARVLETDYLLGMRHVPLIIPAAASPSSAGPVVANQPKVLRLDLPAEEYAARRQKIVELAERVAVCRQCHLAETRTKVVPGQGDVRTRLVFVGEAPGFDEDQQGLAFVGKAGQLLTKMIEAMGLSRDWVYICNILKCRPPDNRTPVPDEITACWPFLDEQLRIIQPDIIVALGKPASQTLLRTDESIGQLRGVWREYYCSGTVGVGEPIALMPTYHPAYLLRSPGEKGKAWSDLKQVMARLELTPPGG
jgi:DNA polymerase